MDKFSYKQDIPSPPLMSIKNLLVELSDGQNNTKQERLSTCIAEVQEEQTDHVSVKPIPKCIQLIPVASVK